MEDRTYKKTLAVIIVLALFGIAYFGSYLPMRKSQFFITTLQDLSSHPATSFTDLKNRITPPLDYYSPLGQEELVRNVADSVLSFVQSTSDRPSIDAFVGFISGYFDPIIARGRGMSFGQDLYIMGAVNEVAFVKTGEASYLDAARQIFEEGEALGPNRPQALYGLFDVYRGIGDVTDTIAVAQKILINWPTDTRIASGLQEFLATMKKVQPPTTPAHP